MKYSIEHKNLGLCPIKILSCLFFVLLGVSSSYSASNSLDSFNPSSVEWELYHQDGTTKVYQAKKSHPSGLVPLKASTILNHPLKRVYSVLCDYDRRMEWVPRLKKSYTFKKIGSGHYLGYSLYRSPWPFKNRSVLVNVIDKYDPKQKSIKSIVASMNHPNLPLVNSDVRFDTKGNFFLKEVAGGKKTYAEVTLLNDFKGHIPIWLVNFVQRRWPRKMFKNINKQLNKKDIELNPDFLDIIK